MRAVSLRGAMRARHASPLLLLWAVSAWGACAIQGSVVSALSGRVVPRAQVFVRTHADETAIPVRRIADEAGRFCFEDLQAGDYEISAKRFGYLDASYGQKRPGGSWLVLRVGAGQVLQPVIVKMTPQARISGMLVDSDGDPIDGAAIQLLKRAWMNGEFQPVPVTAGQTDDQGRFRLAQLAPGTYYLSAWPRRELRRREFLDAKGEPIREREIETYYAGSFSIQEATPIALKAGQQIAGLTLVLQKAGSRHVSGRILVALSEGETGWVMLLDDGSTTKTMAGRARINKDGSFRADGLASGQYLLRAHISRGRSGLELEKQVDLRNGDAEEIVLEPVQLFDLTVRVRVEGAAKGSKLPPIQQLYLSGDSTNGNTGELQPDGTYKFESVSPGVYQIEVATEGDSCFVKRVLVGGEVQPGRRLDLREKPKSIEVILSSRVATIQGHVAPEREVTTGTTVVLLDEAGPDDIGSGDTRSGQTRLQVGGPNGEFEFKSMPPGKYRLYAFEDFDRDVWGSPELAAIFAPKSVAFELHEGENRQVTLPLISAKEFQDAMRGLGL